MSNKASSTYVWVDKPDLPLNISKNQITAVLRQNLTKSCFDDGCVGVLITFFHSKMVQADPLAVHLHLWQARGAQAPT